MFPERLAKGYRAFLDGRFKEERGRYAALADSGQAIQLKRGMWRAATPEGDNP